MSPIHVAIVVALVVVNLAAGLYGVWVWWRGASPTGFWPLLRAGQALALLQGVIALVLWALGVELPRLHLVYALTPIGISFMAEQLRLSAAQIELDRRGIEGRAAIERLAEAQRRALIGSIMRREVGIMAASALVVAILGMRASEWF